MPFTINTNIASLQAQSYLRVTNEFQSKTINRVTSGLRIVTSGDDAAGLAIANGYRSDQAALAQGVRNASDGLSQLQTADGGINNISQLLDRLRTLATQSASGAFTGDRSVLNSEFQNVIGEIDRQAQAIGLNQGGAFATALSVFIGGGKSSNGVTATTNGSVALDLSHSTVDSSSLGLKGVQAVGVSGTDIGSGSPSTTLAQLIANSANAASVATPGFTTFIFKGPGFDGNGVKVSLNTANLGGTADLAAAVNAAIGSAGNGGSQQATSFKNANVLATINTDASGKQQLVFKSASTAFQVEAGDKLSNALLGNFERNAASTSTDTNGYADTSSNATLTFAIDGAATFDVVVTSGVGTSKGQIAADLNANLTFAGVATAYLDGNQVVVKSKTNSASSSVAVTSSAGTLATTLGFVGTASAASASTGADLNVRVQGAGVVAAAANVIGTDSGTTATIATGSSDTLILTVGATGPTTLTLTGGTGLTKAQIAADINTQIGTSALAGTVSAQVVNDQIVLAAAVPGQSITVGAGTADAALGFTAATVSSGNTVATSDTITLRFQGSGLISPVDITLSATTAGTTTTAQVLTDLQAKIAASGELSAAGITLSTSTAGNNLVFTSNKGEQFQVIATGDSRNILGLGSFAAGAGSAVDYTSITAGSTYSPTGASGTATFEVSLNGKGSSSNIFSANLAGGDAVAGARTGTVVYTVGGAVDLSGDAGTDKLSFRIDGGAIVSTAAFGAGAATTIASILTTINTALGAAGTATLDGSGNIVIRSATKGANSNVEIVAAGAGASDANVLTKLGLTAGSTHGTNATEGNVILQLNASISSNAALVAAGLQAQDNGSGKIQIVSVNGTYFRLNARNAASGYTGDAGFGFVGSSFAGQAQGAAPTTSPYFSAQGVDASSVLAYSDTLYGSDDQTIGILATDGNGAKHSLTVALRNDTTARYRTIDEALNAVNAALQQSNDSTLNRIVAVKDESNGVQSFRFISTVRGFQVTVSSDPNSTGVTPPTGNQSTATTVGAGANADIGDVASAQAALEGVADAVSLLGRAQAVVGRGQNQFTFAINLAQSQLTNLAAAESRIRDADLAAESANLTKSQILLQAGIAALAQANAAPQQVLTLLRG